VKRAGCAALFMTQPAHFVQMNDVEFLKEATAIVENAQSKGIFLRFLGAFAVYVHSLDNDVALKAFKSLGRLGEGKPMFTDLDLALYGKQRGDATKLLEHMGFKPDNMANMMFGGRRLIYHHPQGKFPIDLFVDKLEFSHDVYFGTKPGSGRLELDYPTISAADIVLEKLQIHQINRKDVLDLVVLFLGHDVLTEAGKDVIDGGYVSRILSSDWGFWYDAMNNLASVEALARDLANQNVGISSGQCVTVTNGVAGLRRMIDACQKTKDWEKRAKIGTSKPWYREVGEVSR
jgi:hypothetical protein